MTRLALAALLAATACGSKPEPTTTPTDTPAVRDTRTPLERRRDIACKALGPKITTCAIADAQAAAQKGDITQKQLAEISAPEITAKNTSEFIDKCEVPMSSRQVRVLEVCGHTETECAPLISCLEHLNEPGH